MADKKSHWEGVYADRGPDEVSWFQADPAKSLEFIRLAGLPKGGAFIDVGGGASVLVDRLQEAGFEDLSVLDISAKSLSYSKERLSAGAGRVHWFEADVLSFAPDREFALWHDRAVFHFLTEPGERARYTALMGRAVKIGGHAILATFAPDGPAKCSGLEVRRYDAALMKAELGPGFELVRQDAETHVTPWDQEQRFAYFLFRRV